MRPLPARGIACPPYVHVCPHARAPRSRTSLEDDDESDDDESDDDMAEEVAARKKKKGATAPKSKGGGCWFKTALATAFREDLADQPV